MKLGVLVSQALPEACWGALMMSSLRRAITCPLPRVPEVEGPLLGDVDMTILDASDHGNHDDYGI